MHVYPWNVCLHAPAEHLCVSILCVLHISHFEYVCLYCMWLVCHHHYNTSTVSTYNDMLAYSVAKVGI